MEGEIINRVANSKLRTIDLEDFYPEGERTVFDLADYLFEGLILREKDFRKALDQLDWTQYKDTYVAISCSTDAILPSWAYILVTCKLQPFAKKIVSGDLELLETVIFQQIIQDLDFSEYKNAPTIVKGCTNKPIPQSAYSFLIERLQPVCKSIMFGEACSTVPLFKK